MHRRFAAACLTLTLLSACGGETLPPLQSRMQHWKQAGDAAWDAKHYEKAVPAYRRLYALVEPTPAQRRLRAVLSFRMGHAMGQLAQTAPHQMALHERVRDARIWLREAEHLRPEMFHIWYERAQLIELTRHADDPHGALVAAYTKYIAGVTAAGGTPSEAEQSRLRLAQTRLRELAD